MKFNKIFKKTDSLVTIVLIIGIIAVVNFFSYKIFHRWDLTENKDYSISDVSKNAMGELDDIINVKVYFSKNLPSQYITINQEVGDILDEYVSYSGGKLKVEFIDPDSLEDPEQELAMMGIPSLIFDVIEKDKRQTVKGFLGMAIQYEDNQEVIPVITNTADLEYQITLAIKKVINDEMPSVAFLSSNGTADRENEIQALSGELEKIYKIEDIDLSGEQGIPSTIDTLIILGATEEFSEEQLKAIDAFVLRGGSLLVAMEGVLVGDNLTQEPNETNLSSLLESYGLRLNKDLVLDVNSEMVQFTLGFLPFNINYPFWPRVINEGFDQENAMVSKLESASFAWASSIDVVDENLGENTEVHYLAKTSKKSWTQGEGSYDLNPQQSFEPTGDIGPKNLAVYLNGEVKSFYNPEEKGNARIILVGDSNFIVDGFLGRAPENLVFAQNLVDGLSFDEDLINIRSKGVLSRPVKDLEDSQRAMYRYLNVFGVTVLVIAFGMFRYYRRRKRKFEDEF